QAFFRCGHSAKRRLSYDGKVDRRKRSPDAFDTICARYLLLGGRGHDQIVSQVLPIVIVQEGSYERHEGSAGVVAAKSIKLAVNYLRLERIARIAAISPNRVMVGIEENCGLLRIEMPVLHPDVIHPPIGVDVAPFKKI